MDCPLKVSVVMFYLCKQSGFAVLLGSLNLRFCSSIAAALCRAGGSSGLPSRHPRYEPDEDVVCAGRISSSRYTSGDRYSPPGTLRTSVAAALLASCLFGVNLDKPRTSRDMSQMVLRFECKRGTDTFNDKKCGYRLRKT